MENIVIRNLSDEQVEQKIRELAAEGVTLESLYFGGEPENSDW